MPCETGMHNNAVEDTYIKFTYILTSYIAPNHAVKCYLFLRKLPRKNCASKLKIIGSFLRKLELGRTDPIRYNIYRGLSDATVHLKDII